MEREGMKYYFEAEKEIDFEVDCPCHNAEWDKCDVTDKYCEGPKHPSCSIKPLDDDIERLAELGKAVEWYTETNVGSEIMWIADDYYFYYEGEYVELLKAYRQAQEGGKDE